MFTHFKLFVKRFATNIVSLCLMILQWKMLVMMRTIGREHKTIKVFTEASTCKKWTSGKAKCPKQLLHWPSLIPGKGARSAQCLTPKKGIFCCSFWGWEKWVREWWKWKSMIMKKKPYCYLGKVFVQWTCRIILWPQKHALHLVWSAFVISTAIRTALKVARGAKILGEKRPI